MESANHHTCVLGIDPGSHATGYAFLQLHHGNLVVLEYGVLKAKVKDDLMARLGYICQELEERIRVHKPTLLAMESSFYSENARTALVLGHARGAVMSVAYRYKMSFMEFSPRSIKKACTGSGAASKERVAAMMQYHLRLADLVKQTDASDALAVAWTSIKDLSTPQIQNVPLPKMAMTNRSEPLILAKHRSIANAIPQGADIQAIYAQARKRKRK